MLLGDVRHAQGRYAEALSAYREAQALDPKSASVIARIAKCDLKLHNLSAALAELEVARELAPDDLEIRDAIASAPQLLAAQPATATPPSSRDMSP